MPPKERVRRQQFAMVVESSPSSEEEAVTSTTSGDDDELDGNEGQSDKEDILRTVAARKRAPRSRHVNGNGLHTKGLKRAAAVAAAAPAAAEAAPSRQPAVKKKRLSVAAQSAGQVPVIAFAACVFLRSHTRLTPPNTLMRWQHDQGRRAALRRRGCQAHSNR